MYRSGMKLFFLVGLAVLSISAQDTSTLSFDQRRNAVEVARILNTAEAQFFHKAGHYGLLDDLRASGALKESQSMLSSSIDMSSDGQPISEFVVQLNTSVGKDHYQLSITKSTKPFFIGFFTDERGLIYEGHPLK
jgi:hypothetical protein